MSSILYSPLIDTLPWRPFSALYTSLASAPLNKKYGRPDLMFTVLNDVDEDVDLTTGSKIGYAHAQVLSVYVPWADFQTLGIEGGGER